MLGNLRDMVFDHPGEAELKDLICPVKQKFVQVR